MSFKMKGSKMASISNDAPETPRGFVTVRVDGMDWFVHPEHFEKLVERGAFPPGAVAVNAASLLRLKNPRPCGGY